MIKIRPNGEISPYLVTMIRSLTLFLITNIKDSSSVTRLGKIRHLGDMALGAYFLKNVAQMIWALKIP
jgi:hypothetical protein